MKITDILKERGKGIAFEFFPPKTEHSKKSFATAVKFLKEYKPLYVSMTCGARGTKQDYTIDAVDTLLQEKELVIMPHLTCVDIKAEEMKRIIERYKQKGICNIMALRGDPPQDLSDFSFLKQDFCCARDLVKLIKQYNHFCIGVAVYPEGHIETPSIEQDLEYTKQKIDAGADFSVTQMFFDNKYYYALLERMNKKRINIPVLPGILPLTDIAKVKQFVSIARTTIPKGIEMQMSRFINQPQDMEKLGIDFTIKQCRDLIKNGVKHLHFFTFNKPEIIKTILDAI